MNHFNDVVSLLRAHENTSDENSEPAWQAGLPGFTEAEILEMEEEDGEKYPDDWRKFLAYTKCGWFYGSSTHVELGADVDDWNTDLPGMLLLGYGAGAEVYYFDPQNLIGKGAWAVYLVSLGSRCFKDSSYVASSFTHFLQRLINGDELREEPWLQYVGLPAEASDHVRLKFCAEAWEHLEAIPLEDRHTPSLLLHSCDGELWSPKMAVSGSSLEAAEQQLGVQLPEDFREFLLFSNGGKLGKLSLFTLERCINMSSTAADLPVLSGAIFVARDDQYWYYFSAHPQVGHPAWTIFLVDQNQAERNPARCAAKNFTHLLQRVLQQENLAFPSLIEIDEARQHLGERFPQMYWDFYSVQLGELRLFATIHLFTAHELFYYNIYLPPSRNLPQMIVFGTHGNHLFFFDPEGKIHQEKWAIYSTDRTRPSTTRVTYLAANFKYFLIHALNVLEPYTAGLEETYPGIAACRTLLGWKQVDATTFEKKPPKNIAFLRQINLSQ
jgi:hypothetical protein